MACLTELPFYMHNRSDKIENKRSDAEQIFASFIWISNLGETENG